MTESLNDNVVGERERPFDLEKAGPLLVALLVVVVFAPLVRYEFLVWDDHDTIARNPLFNPVTGESYVRFWSGPHMDMYAPLTYTMWGIVATVARVETADPQGITLNPMIFHGLNILLHAAAAVVVLQILRLLLPGAVWAPLVGAGLWAVHPVQVEPVGWISGGKDVLSGLLGLGALWGYLVFARGIAAGDRTGRPVVMYAVATGCLVLAMLAKPSAIVVPLLAGVMDALVLRRPMRQIIGPVGVWVVLAIPIAVVAYIFQQTGRESVVSPLWARPLVALDALAFYLFKLVAPMQLAPDYGRTPQRLLDSAAVYWTWAVPVAVGVVCWIYRRRWAWLGAGFVLFVAAVSPVLGLARFDFQFHSTVADHYLYLAMLGPALVVTSLLAAGELRIAAGRGEVDEARPVPPLDKWIAVGLVLIALLSLRSLVQTWHWRDSQTLFEHTLTVTPNSIVANNVLGLDYANQADALRLEARRAQAEGDIATAQHWGELAERLEEMSIERHRVSLEIRPDPIVRFNLANRLQLRNPEEAIEQYRQAIETAPERNLSPLMVANIQNNLGTALLRMERYDDAAGAFRAAIELEPEFVPAHANLGIALMRLGRTEEAIEQFERALELDPQFEIARRNLQSLREAEKEPEAPQQPDP